MVNSGGNDILAEREIQFSAALRGYDRREVDAYIRRLRARAGHLASELAEKDRRLSEVGGDPSVPLQVVGSGNLGARVERIIAQAEHEAREIREQAETDASETRKAYEDQAEEARRQRAELARRAEEQARAMIRAAEAEVARLRGTRQTVFDQLVAIGEIIDTAADQAARTPELRVSFDEVLGSMSAESSESTEDDQAVAAGADVESEEDSADDPGEPDGQAAPVAGVTDEPDAPVVVEPRRPGQLGKVTPAILAAKARRQAKQDQAAAVAADG